jgi:ABC-type multidrug transport system ATPase subunit
MKRRLSMAIAFTGDPKIVFLDEPTTGMDPKNRRYIWDLIMKMKKGKMIILTTHAMEEADILSDRIAVVVDGTLKCIGTPLYLKNRFGDGYRLNLVSEVEYVEDLIKEATKIIPSASVIDSSGGSIIFTVPLIKIIELQAFFRYIRMFLLYIFLELWKAKINQRRQYTLKRK